MRITSLIALLNCVFSAATDATELTLPVLKTDIEFAKISEVSLTLDAFVPEGSGPFPTCILVHRGGFVRGDKQSYIEPLFEPLSKAGFRWTQSDAQVASEESSAGDGSERILEFVG